ncbi:flagellar export chaperone FliS [Oribacterium sp. HCP28S3_H8]|uniref:flagellar export chaperone FliS n=1 Tax=Oribacterium sp. HCP28S3_H8 TaxID=3438945 RepID=UPI003F8B0F3E
MENSFQKYKENSILSMSQPELLLLCFDEAIRNLRKAQISLDDKEYEYFEASLQKTSRIIRYLTVTLEMNVPISADLKRLYNYINFDIGRLLAGRERRKDELPALIQILAELREGFEGASREAGNAAQGPSETGIVV